MRRLTSCLLSKRGSTPEEEKQLLAEVRQFEVKPSELPESEG